MDKDDVNKITSMHDGSQDGLDEADAEVAQDIASGAEDESAAPRDIDVTGAQTGRYRNPDDPLTEISSPDIFNEDDQETESGDSI